MVAMQFIFWTCVPSQSSPSTLAPLTVLARAICASRSSLLPPMLILLHALIAQLIRNGLEPLCDDLWRPERLSSDTVVWPVRAASAALRGGAQASAAWWFGADSAVTACGYMWRKLRCVGGQYSRVRATLMVFSCALAQLERALCGYVPFMAPVQA